MGIQAADRGNSISGKQGVGNVRRICGGEKKGKMSSRDQRKKKKGGKPSGEQCYQKDGRDFLSQEKAGIV